MILCINDVIKGAEISMWGISQLGEGGGNAEKINPDNGIEL